MSQSFIAAENRSTSICEPQHQKGGPSRIGTLDGLRAIAVLLVLWAHTREDLQAHFLVGITRICRPGYVGVDLFFVLSGFLITRILLHDRQTGVPLSTFYVRRMLRIFPIYYLTCAVVALFDPHSQYVWNVLYLSNFYYAFHKPYPALGHTWSLAVEEQFYLLWPLLIRVPEVRNAYRVPAITALVAVISAVVYTIATLHSDANLLLYCGTMFRMLSLSLGALIACFETKLLQMPHITTVLCCASFTVAAIGGSILKLHTGAPWAECVRLVSFASLSFSVVLACIAVDRKRITASSVLRSSPLSFLGRISYGVYMYHFPIFFYLGIAFASGAKASAGRMMLAYGIVLVIATLSYHYLEVPMLRLRSRISSRFGNTPAYISHRKQPVTLAA